jgi:protein-disulfide isomerase
MASKARISGTVLLGLLGVIVSSLAAMSHHFPWMQGLCVGQAEGCREVAAATLFKFPLWAWGIGFYVVVLMVSLKVPPALPWLLGAGLGVEAGLLDTMFAGGGLCWLCIFNSVLLVALALVNITRHNMWQVLAWAFAALWLFSGPLAQTSRSLPRADPGGPPIAARVAGQSVTMEELERPILARLYDLEVEGHRLRKERLDQMVTQILLEREAARRGVTLEELVLETVRGDEQGVTSEEVEEHLRLNPAQRAQWKVSPAEVDARVRALLTQRKSYQKVAAYARSLAGEGEIALFLEEPRPPRVQVDGTLGVAQGPPGAPVTIVQFSDYLCPACRRSHEVVRRVLARYGDQVRYVYRDFPLRSHSWAFKAAEAARCAADQDKFSAYQDLLFHSEVELNPDHLKEYARRMGLEMQAFTACLDSGAHAAEVQQDIDEARRIGVSVTPTVIVNGRLTGGSLSPEALQRLIDEELAPAQRAGR